MLNQASLGMQESIRDAIMDENAELDAAYAAEQEAMYDMVDDYRDDDYLMGDPRKCPRHPHVKTSSDDGMFDAPCYVCEAEADAEAEAWEADPANPFRRFCDAGVMVRLPSIGLVACVPTDDDIIPF